MDREYRRIRAAGRLEFQNQQRILQQQEQEQQKEQQKEKQPSNPTPTATATTTKTVTSNILVRCQPINKTQQRYNPVCTEKDTRFTTAQRLL